MNGLIDQSEGRVVPQTVSDGNLFNRVGNAPRVGICRVGRCFTARWVRGYASQCRQRAMLRAWRTLTDGRFHIRRADNSIVFGIKTWET